MSKSTQGSKAGGGGGGAGGGLSLYANLLAPSADSSAPGTISSAPVVYKQPGVGDGNEQRGEDGQSAKKVNAAALRFQPTKRPQIQAQKGKSNKSATTRAPGSATAGSSNPSSLPPVASSSASDNLSSTPAKGTTQPAAAKSRLDDWMVDEDDVNGFYEQKRERGGRKKRKKNKEAPMVQDWDDIYDPARPNNYEEYLHSEERIRESRDWKDRLYAHRMRRSSSDDSSADEGRRRRTNPQFAPPSALSFAPPSFQDDAPPPPPATDALDVATGDDAYARRMLLSQGQPPPPPPPADVPNDATGEDAYTRRLRMSQQEPPPPPSPPPPPPSDPPSEAPPATISRAPVRYNLPAAPAELPEDDAALESALAQEETEEGASADPTDPDAPRSLRPGQKGFAARLMAKYGWTKGTGLGASGSGILNPLSVKVEKRKQRPDSEGGGFIGPGGKGTIVGGKKSKAALKAEESPYGIMSEVVVLGGMLKGMDVAREIEEGLMQEIGDECGEKYGRVERVFVDQAGQDGDEGARVFVKFTSQLSALRAVNALEGRPFNGNTISARFFDAGKFESGIYS